MKCFSRWHSKLQCHHFSNWTRSCVFGLCKVMSNVGRILKVKLHLCIVNVHVQVIFLHPWIHTEKLTCTCRCTATLYLHFPQFDCCLEICVFYWTTRGILWLSFKISFWIGTFAFRYMYYFWCVIIYSLRKPNKSTCWRWEIYLFRQER